VESEQRMSTTEPPPLAERAKDYGLRLSCCWPGDKRIVHAARSVRHTAMQETIQNVDRAWLGIQLREGVTDA
jgi:hypothetical protein